MRNIVQSNAQVRSQSLADQRQTNESEHKQTGEFSMASLQLDELLQELSREAGFKTRKTSGGGRGKGVMTTKDGGGRTILSWEADGGTKNFGEHSAGQSRCGYFSDAELEINKSSSVSPTKKVINIEYRPKQRCYSAKIIEKTQTRQEYIKEEFLGNKEFSSANRIEVQTPATISIDGRTSSVGTISNEFGSRQFQNQKVYSSELDGIKVAPVPPPRKHISSPDPTFSTSQMYYQAHRHPQNYDCDSKTLSPVSSTSTLRKGRFETTNSQHLSPPLEVKGIAPASSVSTFEGHSWLEEQKRKLERSRYSVDRITGVSHGADFTYRSGSLDIDLDDLVQRNLTNRSVATHQISSATSRDERECGQVEKGSYYISGIERPAVRTRLPQTKYIFKITSPDNMAKGSSKKTQKEIFTTHITAPPIPPPPPPHPPPPPQFEPTYDPSLRDVESSLKSMIESSMSDTYKEQEKFNRRLKPAKLDDEIISLEPIGPGVQLLEPDIGSMKTLRYQDAGTPRIDSRSNSLARHPASSRTLSPCNTGMYTLSNYSLNHPTNFDTCGSYARQTQQTQQSFSAPYQPGQVPASMATHLSRKDAYEGFSPPKNQLAQQHQQRYQQNQNNLQHQQYPVAHVGMMDGKIGGFRSEQYTSMSITRTVSNEPLANTQPLPSTQPLPTTQHLPSHKQLEFSLPKNQTPREILVPISIEGKSKVTGTSISESGRHATTNFIQNQQGSSSYVVSQTSKESESTTRHVPVVHEGSLAKQGSAHGISNATGAVASGEVKYSTFESKSHETPTTLAGNAGDVSQSEEAEISGSWRTVSSNASVVATKKVESQSESKTESKTETSNTRVAEVRTTNEASLSDTEAKQIRDMSNFWHKPHITRQEAIEMLRNKPSGSFVVRNSHTFAGGYGLALKVSHLPPNVQTKGDDVEANLVRHYLVESTPKGVKLKGCSNEPVFPSLSALIHQHSITPLSLPCKLLLPDVERLKDNATNKPTSQNENYDNINNNNNNNMGTLSSVHSNFSYNNNTLSDSGSQSGSVLYIDTSNTESLTGPDAMWKAINGILELNWEKATVTRIDFRISSQGVVLTDNKHKLFFRRHYPLELISYCAVDQSGKIWTISDDDGNSCSGRVFGFVAKKLGGPAHNFCHLFMETDPKFSASTVVGLVNSLLL